MRTTKELLRKAEQYRANALTAPAAYRLYVFVPWAKIPEDIKPHFSTEAAENWDSEITTEGLAADTELQIISILNALIKGKVVESLMFLPLIFADLYILGHGTSHYEGQYTKLVTTYAEDYEFDTIIADLDAIRGIGELLTQIIQKMGLDLEFDATEIVDKILAQIENQVETHNVSQGLNQGIDDAIQRYSELTGEDLLTEIDTGEDLLQDVLDPPTSKEDKHVH